MHCASSLVLKVVAAAAAFVCLTGCSVSTTNDQASNAAPTQDRQGRLEAVSSSATNGTERAAEGSVLLEGPGGVQADTKGAMSEVSTSTRAGVANSLPDAVASPVDKPITDVGALTTEHDATASNEDFRRPADLKVVCERGIAFVDLPQTVAWFDDAGQHLGSRFSVPSLAPACDRLRDSRLRSSSAR